MSKILKIGHRGAKGYFPENTLISFKHALDLNVEGVELDVHLTADNVVVVIHDETTNRTTDTKRIVSEMTLSEIQKCKINNEFNIPTLAEVLNLISKNCIVNIELKGNNTENEVAKIINHYVTKENWSYNHFLVSSFNWNAIQKIHAIDNQIPLGILTDTDLSLAIDFARFIKAKTIIPYFHLLTKENVAMMQSLGFDVYTWTVNEIEDVNRIKTFNINGIISDYPDRI